MMSISLTSYHVGYSPGRTSIWSDFPHGLTRVRNMCKPEREIDFIRELADGSLVFYFGESQPSRNKRACHPSGSTKKANNFSSSHVEQITSDKNSFLRTMTSNFVRQSLIPISAEKTGYSIRNQRHQDVGSDVVQDNFGSAKVNGKTHNVNHIKSVYRPSQRSSPAYGKGSSISFSKDEDGPRLNKLSVDYEIVGLFKRLLSSIKKGNPENKEKSYNRFPNSKFENRDHPTKSVWHQYNEKTKEEFKEYASRRQSSMGEEKVPARKYYSKREPQNTKYEKATKIIDKSLSEAFLLSRPPSKFVRSSPIPLSAIKQDVRPVPGMKESKISFAEKKSTGQDGGILQDSEEMSRSAENDSFLSDSPCLSEDKLNDLSELKLVEFKMDGGKLRDLDGTPTSLENGSVRRILPSLSGDKSSDLSELKHVELKKIAKSYGLKGFSKLKKAELLELLRNAVRQP